MADEQPQETQPQDTPEPTPGDADAPAGEQAEAALESVEKAVDAVTEAAGEPGGERAVDLPDFGAGGAAGGAAVSAMSLLDDVSLRVKVELGRTTMYVEDVLRLNADSVIELDKAAGDPVDIYVNNRHVARGEVLVLNENFCVRVSEIIETGGPEDEADS